MLDKQKKILKNTLGTALATFFSRILGLVRVMLEARILGGGTIASAWGYAFQFPNLFRRILGEGALGAVLVPMMIKHEAEKGIETTRKEMGVIFSVLGIILALVVIITSLIGMIVGKYATTEHIKTAMQILPLVMPYAFFICLIGIAQSILNTKKVFVLPAYGALILNIFLISTLGAFCYIKHDTKTLLNSLSLIVIIAGIVHLLLMIILMAYYKILPDFKFKSIPKKELLLEILKKVLPGIIGASVLQISMIIDRTLATTLGAEALPALNYTERIVYLPIGIVALSFGSVLQVNMSKSFTEQNNEDIINDLIFGLRHVLFMCVPLSLFIMVFREDIIITLFYKGAFTLSNVRETSWAMLFYSLGICFFCSLKLVTPLFYSRGDIKTPMKSAIAVLFLNLALNLILMFPMKQGGLALATAISGFANNAILLWIFHKNVAKIPIKKIFKPFWKALLAAAAGLTIFFVTDKIDLASYNQPVRFAILIAEGAVFGMIYLGINVILRNQELSELFNLVLKRTKKQN